MIWLRGAFRRFRYDQLMNIRWKRIIPLGMAAILVNALAGMMKYVLRGAARCSL